MGTLTCQQLNDRAMFLMQDKGIPIDATVGGAPAAGGTATPGNVRWTITEVLMWISDAQRAIIVLRPNSYNKVARMPLVAGARQVIPDDGWLLLTVNSNVTALSGGDYGRATLLTTFDQMNRSDPNWRSGPKRAEVNNYMFDLTDQRAFYVWPPNNGSGFVEINYSAMPTELTAMTDKMQLDDVFAPMVVDYICMRASMKDAEFGPGLNYATFFRDTFTQTLTGKDTGEKEQNPDAALPPASNR